MSREVPFQRTLRQRNMAIWPKPCSKLNRTTFTIFIIHCEHNSGLKSVSECYSRSYGFLLTRSLPITNILFLTEVIYCKIFRCSYLRNEKYFLNFFFAFSKFRFNFEHFQKKDYPHSWCIFELKDSEKRG